MFTLAHLSDVHLSPLPRPTIRELMSKRILGYANWLRKRSEIHQRSVLDALVADLRSQDADHITVTGDLVNISLPAEFEAALAWLRSLGDPSDVTVVPGNHDAYVKLPHETGTRLWQDYMAADPGQGMLHSPNASGFPFVRLRGPCALIGLSTAAPTLPFLATGTLDPQQLAALPQILRSLRERELFRVVLIHHPPLPGLASGHKCLLNTEELESILKSEGVELVLYGHNHYQAVDMLETSTGPAPVVGVPSASAAYADGKSPARYNLYKIARAASGWYCTMTGRGLAEPGGKITQIEQTNFRDQGSLRDQPADGEKTDDACQDANNES